MNRVFLLIIIATVSCANPVAPTGGPKDKQPPIIIKTIRDTLNQYLHIQFDENIKFKNEVILNPSKIGVPKSKITRKRKSIQIPIQGYTSHIQLIGSVSDVNENNAGKYPTIILNRDSTNKKITIIKPPFLKKKTPIALTYIDSYIYTHQVIEDTAIICCLEKIQKADIFLDQNKNYKLDEEEWYSTDNVHATFLYPPIKPILQIDTSHDEYLIIVGEYRYIQPQLHLLDTISLRKQDIPFMSILSEKYKINYQSINNPIHNKIFTFQDSIIKQGLTIEKKQTDTSHHYDTIPLGSLSINNTTPHNISIELYQNQKPIVLLQSPSLKKTPTYLRAGKYYILSYYDSNSNNLFDSSDKVYQYFEETSVVKDMINEFIVNITPIKTEKTSKTGVKERSIDPKQIQLK